MRLKTCSQNAETKPGKVRTHNFWRLFSQKPAKLEKEKSTSKVTRCLSFQIDINSNFWVSTAAVMSYNQGPQDFKVVTNKTKQKRDRKNLWYERKHTLYMRAVSGTEPLSPVIWFVTLLISSFSAFTALNGAVGYWWDTKITNKDKIDLILKNPGNGRAIVL